VPVGNEAGDAALTVLDAGTRHSAMKLILLDRDGVVVVNRPTNIKQPADLDLLDGVAQAIRLMNDAGFTVSICTNQPEVARGVISPAQLDRIHHALQHRLRQEGASIDRVFSCTSSVKCPRRKPAGRMVREAMEHYGARASETPFVGDQLDDLRAAFHAGCRRVLVRTGLGSRTLAGGIPDYLKPVAVCDDLLAVAHRLVPGASGRL